MASEILKVYGDTSVREDVNAFVELITAVEAWFLNNLGKTQAYGPVHQTQVDTLNIKGGVYKSSLIDSEAEMPTRRKLKHRERLNKMKPNIGYVIV